MSLRSRSGVQGQGVSRANLLAWASATLDMDIASMDEMHSGAVYCQLVDAYCKSVVAMSKVNFEAQYEHSRLANYKQLQAAFNAAGLDKEVEAQRLVKSPVAQQQLLTWLHEQFSGKPLVHGYDPHQRRAISKGGRATRMAPLPPQSGTEQPTPAPLAPGRLYSGGTGRRGLSPVGQQGHSKVLPTDLQQTGVSATQDGDLAAAPAPAVAAPAPDATPRQKVLNSGAAAESMAPQTPEMLIEQDQHASVRDQESSPQPSYMDDAATSGSLAPLQIPVPSVAQSQEADTPTQDAGERETFSRALPARTKVQQPRWSIAKPGTTATGGTGGVPLRRQPSTVELDRGQHVEEFVAGAAQLNQAEGTARQVVTTVVRSISELQQGVKDVGFENRDGAILRAKLRNKRSRTSLALKEAWTLVKDLHQLGSLQAGTAGKARARHMESLMRELGNAEKAYRDVCDQIAKAERFFPLTGGARGEAVAHQQGGRDTRVLDAALRAVAQSTGGLGQVYDLLPPHVQRASQQLTPSQLRRLPSEFAGTASHNGLARPPSSISGSSSRPSQSLHGFSSAAASAIGSDLEDGELTERDDLGKWGLFAEPLDADVAEVALLEGGTSHQASMLDSAHDIRKGAPPGRQPGSPVQAVAGSGLPRPPSQTNSAGRSAASERTTLIHEEAEVEPAQQQLPAEQGATPDGPAAERQQAAPGPRGGGMVSRWRRRMGTGERLPDVLTREPQVAQALAPPQTPPPMDAETISAATTGASAGSAGKKSPLRKAFFSRVCCTSLGPAEASEAANAAAAASEETAMLGALGSGEDGDAGEAAVQDAIRTLAQQALATGSYGLGSLPNGDTYRGLYSKGAKQGDGVYVFASSDTYAGQFSRDKMHGVGVYSFAGSGAYEGEWEEGSYHGVGVERFARGSAYHGSYVRGVRQGYGVCHYYNKDYFEGQWAGGLRNGRGMQQCADNSNYVGDYKSGKRHGFGVYSFPNGDQFLGQCASDMPHGYGTYVYATGQVYEGQWLHGRKHGWCLYTVEAEEVWAGKWRLGKPRWVSRAAASAAARGAPSAQHALSLCEESARMARDAAAEGRARLQQHWQEDGVMQAAIPAVVEAAALAAMQAQRAQGRAIALADELAAQVAAKPGKAFSLKGKAQATGSSQLGAAVSPMPQAQGDMPTAPAAEEGGSHGPAHVLSSEGQADPSGQQGFAAVPHNGTAAAQLSHSGKRNILAGARARTLRLLQPAKAQVLLSGQ